MSEKRREENGMKSSSSSSNSSINILNAIKQKKVTPVKAPEDGVSSFKLKNFVSKISSLFNIKDKPSNSDKKSLPGVPSENEKSSITKENQSTGSSVSDDKESSKVKEVKSNFGSREQGLKRSISPYCLACRSKTQLKKNSDLNSPERLGIKPHNSSVEKVSPIKASVGKPSPAGIRKSTSKVGSLETIKHKLKNGDKQEENKEVKLKALSKIGYLKNINDSPSDGFKKVAVFDKLNLTVRTKSVVGSLENVLGGGNVKITD